MTQQTKSIPHLVINAGDKWRSMLIFIQTSMRSCSHRLIAKLTVVRCSHLFVSFTELAEVCVFLAAYFQLLVLENKCLVAHWTLRPHCFAHILHVLKSHSCISKSVWDAAVVWHTFSCMITHTYTGCKVQREDNVKCLQLFYIYLYNVWCI